MFMKLNILK